MTIWTGPSPSDFDRWEKLVYEQRIAPWEAAKQLGFGGSSTFKRVDPQRHRELLAWWRDSIAEEDREYVRDKLRQNVEQSLQAVPVFNREGEATGEYRHDGQTANRSLELLGKTVGMFGDTTRVEMTGAGGGPIELEDRSASLADVARVLEAVGALTQLRSGPPRAEVPDARPLLPAPVDG